MVSTTYLTLRAAQRFLARRSFYQKYRTLSTKKDNGYTWDEPIPENYTIDSIKPPKYWGMPPDQPADPMAYTRKPVSSAHMIDLSASPPQLSVNDSVTLTPSGTVTHGRYGELSIDPESGIPLEYLALLGPAVEGTAALRSITKGAKHGTVLIYGAGEPAGMATLQLASANGLAVVGVVSGQQSGNDDFVDSIKDMTNEPGTVLPEEFAIVKGYMKEIVDAAVSGDSQHSSSPDVYLEDFQKNLLNYANYFPETQLTPNPEEYSFSGKEKDRKYFNENISTYLSQFQNGSPSFSETVLKETFTKEQYAIFKSKFGEQMTAILSNDDAATEFNPAAIVKNMTEIPEQGSRSPKNESKDGVEFEFSVLSNKNIDGEVKKGGPVLGAVINVTPDLKVAVEAVAKASTVRGKAESLQFLTESQKNAFAAARSVMSIAEKSGKPVLVVGGNLPNFESVKSTDADVDEVISAMKLEEDGSSRLNYFLQVYRASDYPVYADYAIHRSQEELSGPRQIVVTK